MRTKKNNGFTLIELLVVLSLISIIALIAVPKINRNYGYLESYSKDLLYDIRYIREGAMAGKKGYKIRFGNDSDVYYYEIFIDTNNDNVQDDDAAEGAVKKYLKNDYEITTSVTDYISFEADGSLKKTDAQTIIIKNKNDPDDSIKLIVNILGNSFIE